MTPSPVTPLPVDQSKVKGGLQERRRRELPDGSLVEFEYAPIGYLTAKGEPRRKEWRAYYFTPADQRTISGKRERLMSVSSILEAICPKGGLPRWAEARGIEGCFQAMRIGEIDPTIHTPEDAIQRVRLLKLGADRARDAAADRGLDAHDALHVYMVTGSLPPKERYPVEDWGYYIGIASWLLEARPEPVEVEQLVASPQDGYAGRSDLVALVNGRRVRYDAKTQERGQIYDSAHVQVQLYERAGVASGDEPCEECRVVVFAADGTYRDMPGAATPKTVEAALAYYGQIKPIVSACESANRAERKARAA